MDTQKKTSLEQTSKEKVDYTRWGKTVRISNETYEFIQKHGKFGETFDEVIRKLLKM
jgi:hypothetical protein